MSVDDCFRKGLLKRVPFEAAKVGGSLALSRHYLERAEGNLKIGYWDVALLMAYNSLLQSAKAVLFADGVQERSHYCCFEYICARHSGEFGAFAGLLDTYRQNRHMTQYGGEAVSEEEARQAVADAKRFLGVVEKWTAKRKA